MIYNNESYSIAQKVPAIQWARNFKLSRGQQIKNRMFEGIRSQASGFWRVIFQRLVFISKSCRVGGKCPAEDDNRGCEYRRLESFVAYAAAAGLEPFVSVVAAAAQKQQDNNYPPTVVVAKKHVCSPFN